MKNLEKINMGELRGAVKALNDSKVIEEKLKVAKIKKEDIVKNFTTAIESLDEEGQENLPKKVIVFYNDLYEDESEESEEKKDKKTKTTKATTAKASGKGKTVKKTTEKKASKPNERREFITSLLQTKKYTQTEIIEKTLSKFPQYAKSTITTELCDGKNPKYNKFPKLVVTEKDGITCFGR